LPDPVNYPTTLGQVTQLANVKGIAVTQQDKYEVLGELCKRLYGLLEPPASANTACVDEDALV
jgi:hypothetical protein